MAYVEGQRIDRWCDGRRLDARARVTLFLLVLDAVQYAHRHMVIHRDLKPDNVLVDGDGRVHLLDFGIAKLLEEGVGLDATRELVMTPQYAAPEQLQGKPATAATDIYQLGLMLHALLVGDHPFGVTADMPMASLLRTLDDAPRSLRQAERTLVDDELARRGGNRKRLLRSVSGDLSAIVATCLAQTPEQRYPSADALAQDLRRWLDGQPVSVRSASRGYRLRWFARRYRWALAAVLGIIVALVVGLGLAVQQMREARMQAQRSEQLKNLVMSVFREQDPLERGSNARSPAQVVADGIRGLTPQQLSDPALRGDLLNDLGEIQGSLGDFGGSQRTLQDALQTRTRLYGEANPQVLNTERKLAQLAYAMGNHAEARRRAEHVLAIAARLGQPHAANAARAQLVLALASAGDGEQAQALALVDQAIDDLRRSLGASHPETTTAMYRRAELLMQLRRDDEAIATLRDVITAIERQYGKDSARLTQPLIALGSALRQAQHDPEADVIYARAVALAQRHFPGRSPLLALSLSRYGALKMQRGQLAQAQALLDRAERALPENAEKERVQLLFNRGQLELQLAKPDPAEADLRQALALRRKISGDGNGVTWYYASEWGRALAAQGKLAQAEQVQRDALAETLVQRKQPDAAVALLQRSLALIDTASADLRRGLGAGAPETSLALMRRAQLLQQLRRDDEAIATLRGAISEIEARDGKDSARLVEPLTALGSALRQAQRDEESDAAYARAVALAQRYFPGRNRLLASQLSRYGALKMQRGQLAQAQALLDRAEQAMPDGADAELAQLLLNRGQLELQQSRADAAEADLRRAFDLRRAASGEDSGPTWYYASEWGRALALQGKLAQAEQVQRDALARLSAIMGEGAYQNALVLDALAETLMLAHRPREAAAALQQALALTAGKYPATHPTYQERLRNLREAEQAARQ